MKIAELLTISGDMMRILHGFGIKMTDYKYLALYNDYVKMNREKLKTTYIVTVLASKYNICERKVYKIIKFMDKHCQICAP